MGTTECVGGLFDEGGGCGNGCRISCDTVMLGICGGALRSGGALGNDSSGCGGGSSGGSFGGGGDGGGGGIPNRVITLSIIC